MGRPMILHGFAIGLSYAELLSQDGTFDRPLKFEVKMDFSRMDLVTDLI